MAFTAIIFYVASRYTKSLLYSSRLEAAVTELDDLSSDCAICHKPVGLDNNATTLRLCLTKDLAVVLQLSQHLLPIVVAGEICCPGTPELAQYIEGQPRLNSYDPNVEEVVRFHYHIMLSTSWREGGEAI